MYRFKILASVVQAARIGEDGYLRQGEKWLIGDPGSWLVFDHHGGTSNWTHEEFVLAFEPADEQARLYLEHNRK